MDEIREDIPEKVITPPYESEEPFENKVTLEKEVQTADDEEDIAEMSLEGRKVQLEEKISAEIDRQPEGVMSAPAQPAPYTMQKKERASSGARTYIGIIVGLIVVFSVVFGIECARTYKENGLFGGSLDDILGGGYGSNNPFYPFSGDDEEDDSDPFGMFPFDFEDTDDYGFYDFDEDDTDETETPKNSEKVDAPDESTVIDPNAATLKAEDQPKDIDSANYTARKAYKRVEDSVVNVVVYSGGKEKIGNEAYKEGTGSGIIVSKDGYIITNAHVIENSKEYGVEILIEGTSYAAAVVGFDSRTDLAVLKINGHDLTAAEFVNSDQIEIGQDALAVGNPGGLEYSNSLTRGCVSALNRTVRSNTLVSYIQTDAAINPGNSGGPLLNSAGQVMGITTIKIASTDYEGMGFAIPSNTVIEIANDLISKGYVAGRVKLGILASAYNEYDPATKKDILGIEIKEIQKDSPLVGTEVEAGDIITKVDGQSVSDFSTLYSILGEHEDGDKVTLTLYRPPTVGDAGKTYKVEVTLISDEGDN